MQRALARQVPTCAYTMAISKSNKLTVNIIFYALSRPGVCQGHRLGYPELSLRTFSSISHKGYPQGTPPSTLQSGGWPFWTSGILRSTPGATPWNTATSTVIMQYSLLCPKILRQRGPITNEALKYHRSFLEEFRLKTLLVQAPAIYHCVGVDSCYLGILDSCVMPQGSVVHRQPPKDW